MKCPHCEYTHGYEMGSQGEYIHYGGNEGDFFESPIKMKRSRLYFEDDEVRLFGCPSCGKTFIVKYF